MGSHDLFLFKHIEEQRRRGKARGMGEGRRERESRGIYPGQRRSACGGRGGGGGLQPRLGFFFLGRKLMNYILYLTDGCITWGRAGQGMAWPGNDR